MHSKEAILRSSSSRLPPGLLRSSTKSPASPCYARHDRDEFGLPVDVSFDKTTFRRDLAVSNDISSVSAASRRVPPAPTCWSGWASARVKASFETRSREILHLA